MAAGVVIPFWLDRPPAEALEVAALAEELGYPELWVGEMLHFDAMALAGAIASLTRRITITVGPMALGLRDPILLAMGVGSISVLGGRAARLALGASSPAVVVRWHGKTWSREADRVEEAIALIRSVLKGARTQHHGPHFQSDGFRSALGAQDVHVSVAALGPRMLSAASAAADRVVLNLVPPQFVAHVTTQTNRPVAVWVAAAVDPSPAGWQQLARQVALYLRAPGYRKVLGDAGFNALIESSEQGMSSRQLAEQIGPAILQRVAAVGSLEEVRSSIDAYEEAGAEVMLAPITADDSGGRRTLEALAPNPG